MTSLTTALPNLSITQKIIINPWVQRTAMLMIPLLMHLPCIMIQAGLITIGASMAKFVMSPWVIWAGSFALMAAGEIGRRKWCEKICDRWGCRPASNMRVTIMRQSFAQAVSRSNQYYGRRYFKNGVLVAVGAGLASINTMILSPMVHRHSGHHGLVREIDYSRAILIGNPKSVATFTPIADKNQGDSILIAVNPSGQIVFYDGKELGARQEMVCNAPDMWNMPKGQPDGGVMAMTPMDVQNKLRIWYPDSIDPILQKIDASDLESGLQKAMASAIKKIWSVTKNAPLPPNHIRDYGRAGR